MSEQLDIYRVPKAIAIPTASSLTLQLTGTVVPKARARVTCNGSYLPKRYHDWKQAAVLDIMSQVAKDIAVLPIARAAVKIRVLGKHRGDLDNLAGAILDALVAAGVLKDDRLTCVPELHVSHVGSTLTSTVIELEVL